jgi:hypothetical protein
MTGFLQFLPPAPPRRNATLGIEVKKDIVPAVPG